MRLDRLRPWLDVQLGRRTAQAQHRRGRSTEQRVAIMRGPGITVAKVRSHGAGMRAVTLRA